MRTKLGLAVVGVAGAVVIGCGGGAGDAISAADLETLSELHREILAENDRRSKARRQLLEKAAGALGPDPAKAACDRELPEFGSTEFVVHSSIVERRMLAESFDLERDMPSSTGLAEPRKDFAAPRRSTPMDRVRARAAMVGPRGRVVANLASGVERLLEQKKWDDPKGREARLAFARGYVDRFDYELTIVADEFRVPEHDGKSFVSGMVRGRAFLLDHKLGRVVCAADVDATNSELQVIAIDPRDDGVRRHQTLTDDLERRAFGQAIANLFIAAPRNQP